MGSHHQLAWTEPDAATVLGDFDDARFEHRGVTTEFSREDDALFVESDGPDGVLTRYPVVGVAGIEPLQQYLLEIEPGRVQSFDVTWDAEEERWYHLYPEQYLPAGEGLHWTGSYKNWNARCAECHATGFEKNYDAGADSYASTQAEIGVGCESCHGPGEAHVAWARQGVLPSDSGAGLSPAGLTMDFGAGAEATVQQCAGCHSRRETYEDGNPLPGTPYHDAYRLSTLRPGLYHADGQILDEVYVYGSFLQSKMYAAGVSCTDCHDPHTARRIATGNALCTQCHSEAGNSDFPTLRLAAYDTPEHHFHAPDTEGAQCVACHMIERNYMVIDGRRDHSFRIPRPDLAAQTGAPDACTDCHTDQTPAWAASEIAARYPGDASRGWHYGQVLAPARLDPFGAATELMEIADYAELPGIVRATAMEMLAPVATPEMADRMAAHLTDPDPMVRAQAVSIQRAAPQQTRAERLIPMLDDPSRSVRIATAREFLTFRVARWPDWVQQDLTRANRDWQLSLAAKADFPETQLVLGGIALTTRNFDAALAAFQDAVKMDPQLLDAWSIIIRLQAAQGQREAALASAREALEDNPMEPMLLGLINQLE